MKLIWDNKTLAATIHKVEIYIVFENQQPFSTQIQVVEQDNSLVLEADNEIRDPGMDKPAWYLANTLEQQPLCKMGEVIVKPGHPETLWAIIHDLDLNPTWRREWIETAVESLLTFCEEHAIYSIALPILGAQFGRFETTDFIQLLLRALNKNHPSHLKRIALVVTITQSQAARALLEKMSK